MTKGLSIVAAGAAAITISWSAGAQASPIGIMFERIADSAAGTELALVTVPTFADLLAATNMTSQFSQINVAGGFNSTGLFAIPPDDGGTTAMPLPATGWLLSAGLLGLAAARWRRGRAQLG
jgi:hypothetical protein